MYVCEYCVCIVSMTISIKTVCTHTRTHARMHKHTQTHMILLLYIVNVCTSLLQKISNEVFYYLQYKK